MNEPLQLNKMEELHQSFLPLVKISNFFGFFPYNVQPDGKLKLSWPQIVYIILLFAVLDYIVYLRIMHMDEYTQQGSFLAQISMIIVILLTEFFIFVSHIMNFVNRKFLRIFLISLCKFDEEVSSNFSMRV